MSHSDRDALLRAAVAYEAATSIASWREDAPEARNSAMMCAATLKLAAKAYAREHRTNQIKVAS